jgi:hypothetical protein
MKSKLVIAFAVIAALAVGFFLGRWQARHTVDSYFSQMSRPEVQRATSAFFKAASITTIRVRQLRM